MTKLEIIDAIEKNESVWGVSHHRMYELKAKNIEKISKGEIEYIEYNENYHLNLEINLLNIYKTKAEAEHYLHHANVSRIEHLPFLTWEEFKGGKELYFTNKSGYPKCLRIVDTKLGKKIGLGGANGYFDLQQIYDLTEVNFYKAYDECVRLFMGEE